MKRYRNYILILLGVLFLASCLKEEHDVFEKSVAERLNEAQKQYDRLLKAAPNGWLLEYVAGDADSNYKGAYNFLLKFEGDKVTVSIDDLALSEVKPGYTNPYESVTSLYRFDQDMSVTISFSTYNPFVHYFHEQHGSYTTHKGDFEFTIMEGSDDMFVLRGKKYGNIMEMHRIPDNQSWEGLLEQVNETIDKCNIYSSFEVMFNDNKVGTASVNSNNRYSLDLENGDDVSSNALFTTTGIKFIDPLLIEGKEAQNFNWDDANKYYLCTDDGVNVKLTPLLSPTYLYYEDFIGTYTVLHNGNKTPTVTIEQKIKGKSFTMKGLSDFDIELGYDKTAGIIGLITQDVGKYNQFTVAICPWDSAEGYYTWAVGYGLKSVLNLDKLNNEGVIQFTMVDNGAWSSRVATGFLVRLFDSVLGAHGSATAQGNYTAGTGYQFYNISFTKQ